MDSPIDRKSEEIEEILIALRRLAEAGDTEAQRLINLYRKQQETEKMTTERELSELLVKTADLDIRGLIAAARAGDITTTEFNQICEARKNPQVKAAIKKAAAHQTAADIEAQAHQAGARATIDATRAGWQQRLASERESIAAEAIRQMSAVTGQPGVKPRDKTAVMDAAWQQLLTAYSGDEAAARARLLKALEPESQPDPLAELQKSAAGGDPLAAYAAEYLQEKAELERLRKEKGEQAVINHQVFKQIERGRESEQDRQARIDGQLLALELERKPWLKPAA